MSYARPLVLVAIVVGSAALAGCSASSSDTLMSSDYRRDETMAVQDGRYKTYSTPGSTGTIEHPGVRTGGMTPLAASTDIDVDKDVSRFGPREGADGNVR